MRTYRPDTTGAATRRLRNLSLPTRTLLLATVGLLVILGTLGVLSVRALQESTERVLAERLRLAQLVAADMDHRVAEMFGLLERATTSQEFDLEDQDPEGPDLEDQDLEDPNSNRRILHDLYRAGVFTYGVFLTDWDGIVQLVEPDSLQLAGADLSTYACIRAALQTGQPQASALITNTAIPKPFLAFVVPVKDEAGTVVGLLGGATDLTSPSSAGFLPPLEVGEGGGYIQVVDANGLVIAHNQRGHLFQRAEHADVLLTLMGEKRPGIVTRDVEEEGRGHFAEVIAFVPSRIAPWGVFAEQPKAKALAPVYDLRQRLILIGVVTLLATIVVTWLTTQAVVAPLRELLAASRRIHAGDLSTPVAIDGRDEVAELGHSFEAMRQQLQEREAVIAAWGERLEATVRKRTRELSVLYTIDRAAAQSLDLDEILNDSLDKVLEVLEVEAGGIYLLEPPEAGKQGSRGAEERGSRGAGEQRSGGAEKRGSHGAEEPVVLPRMPAQLVLWGHRGLSEEFVKAGQRIRPGDGVAGRAVAEGRPVVLQASDYPIEQLAPFVAREGFQTLVSVPLVSAGELIGALNLGTRRPRAFPPEELELLTAIGQQLGGAVANARLYQREKQLTHYLRSLNQALLQTGANLDVETVVQTAARCLVEQCEAAFARVWLADEAGEYLLLRASAGLYTRLDGSRARVSIADDRYKLGVIARERRPFTTNQVQEEPDFDRAWAQREGLVSFAGYPVLVEDRLLGVIALFSRQPLSPEILDVLGSFVNQMAIVLANARLFESERKRSSQLALVADIARRATSILDPDRLLQETADAIQQTFGYYDVMLFLVDQEAGEVTMKARAGTFERPFPQKEPVRKISETGIFDWVARHGQTLVANDVSQEPRYRPFLSATRSELCVPIKDGERVVAGINIESERLYAFDEADVVALETLAAELSVALTNARLYKAEQRRAARLTALHELGVELATLSDEADVLRTLVQRTAALAQSPTCTVLLIDEPAGEAVLAAQTGLPEEMPPDLRIPLTLPTLRRSLESGQPIIIPDIDRDAPEMRTVLVRKDLRAFFAYPMVREGRAIGYLTLSSLKPHAPSAEQIAAYRLLADRAAAALGNARMFAETLRHARRMQALNTIISAAAGRPDLASLLEVALDRTLMALELELGAIWVHTTPMASPQIVVRGLPLESGQFFSQMTTHVELDPTAPYIVSDRTETPNPFQELPSHFGIRALITVPLLAAGQHVGRLNVASPEARAWTPGEIALVEAIGRQLGGAVERARLFEELQIRVQELSTVYQVGQTITASLRIGEVLGFIVGAATRAAHAEGCYLFLWDEQQQRLVLRAVEGFYQEHVDRMRYRLGEGLAGWVFLEGEPANIPDVGADPRWKRDPDHEATLPSGQANSALVVPLVVGEKTLGVLGVINKVGTSAFTEGDQSLLTALAGQVAIAIENARLYEDVRGLSIATIRSLATAIDARDPYTRGHSEGVTQLAVQIARELGWGGADLEMLEFAALLHDVGKIGIPDAILHKIEPLTLDERNIIRLHPYYSAQIVKPVESLKRIVSWVYHHHERWNGGGYPDGLKGEEIPLASRIIAVADTYNAMTTDRPYRKGQPHEKAVAELQEHAGTQFDPQVVEAFLRSINENVQDEHAHLVER